MKKTKKIKLEEIKIQSFTTVLNENEKKAINGGGTTLFWCCLEWWLSVLPCEPTIEPAC